MSSQDQLFRRSSAGTAARDVTAPTPGTASAPSPSSAESLKFASVDDWIAREAISFSSDNAFDVAVDRMMVLLGDQVSVLGFGEALHGGEEFLTLRNRFFSGSSLPMVSALSPSKSPMRARGSSTNTFRVTARRSTRRSGTAGSAMAPDCTSPIASSWSG
jgi:hypothetical protein